MRNMSKKLSDYNITVYELVASMILEKYLKVELQSDLSKETVMSEQKLRMVFGTAFTWFKCTNYKEISDNPEYEYIKKSHEDYLEHLNSEAFLSSFSDEFKRFLIDMFCK